MIPFYAQQNQLLYNGFMERRRTLECLGSLVGSEFTVEIEGEEPLLPERRAIVLKAKIIAVDEVSDQKTITLQIPLEHIAGVTIKPFVRE
jgi:hypothetical protein